MKLLRFFQTIAFSLLIAACAVTKNNESQQSGFKIVDSGDERSHDSSQNPCDMVTIFVDAHQSVMSNLGDIKTSNSQVIKQVGEVKGALDEIGAKNAQALQTAQRSLQAIEELSNRQGTGEITLFFAKNSATIEKGSMEYERLVRFADYLSQASRGRKVLFLSIGSSSATGSKKRNLKLAKKRSEAPLELLDKYLVNIPHEFYKVYGTGDLYSPKNIRRRRHQNYQHARIIALFDVSQAPLVNAPADQTKKIVNH